MVGQLIIAEPKNQSRPEATYIIVREWANALEVVEADAGPRSWRPIRIELDGPHPWVILGRCHANDVVQNVLTYLTESHKNARAEWTPETLSSFRATAELLSQCLLVQTDGLVGCEVYAREPFGHGSGDFIVLHQAPRSLYVVPTDLYCYGKTRAIPTVTKDAWHIVTVSPGVQALYDLIAGLNRIEGTEAQRQELATYLDRWVSPVNPRIVEPPS